MKKTVKINEGMKTTAMGLYSLVWNTGELNIAPANYLDLQPIVFSAFYGVIH